MKKVSELNQKNKIERLDIDPFSTFEHQKEILTEILEKTKTTKVILYLHYIKPTNKYYKRIAKVIIKKKSKTIIFEYVSDNVVFDVLDSLNYRLSQYHNFSGLEYYLMKKTKS